MATGDWPKSYVIPSVVLSLGALALLALHLIFPAARVDAWTVTLFVVAFLPWLRTVFERIDFPGGGSVEYRKLEAKQELQGEEIKALQFLVANFLTGDQIKYLRIFASPEPVAFGGDHNDSLRIFQAVEQLKQLGFVRAKTDLNPAALVGSNTRDMKVLFEITQTGLEYLNLLDSTGTATP
jgi:hypothetical protein